MTLKRVAVRYLMHNEVFKLIDSFLDGSPNVLMTYFEALFVYYRKFATKTQQ